MTHSSDHAERARRDALAYHDQMADAQAMCLPCKLCGGNAIISDAGTGAGYYIRCRNSVSFRDSSGCMLDERRLGGWAYNVMDWWNRLHAPAAALRGRDRVVWNADLTAAPYNEVVRVKVGDMTFLATLLPDHSMSDEETTCNQWSAVKEGEHPPCWSAGLCWSSNEDGVVSLQPEAWTALDDTVLTGRTTQGIPD